MRIQSALSTSHLFTCLLLEVVDSDCKIETRRYK